MAKLHIRRGRKQVSPGLLGFRLGQKRDKLNKPYVVLELFPGRLFVLFAVLAVVGYLSAALALYAWRENKLGEHNTVGYMDILLGPVDNGNLQIKLGQSQIAYGMEAYEKQDWRVALMSLQNGLRRYPADQKATLRYAAITFAMGHSQRATDLLVSGLEYGYPEERDYLEFLFQILRYERNLAALERAAELLLEMPEVANDAGRKQGIQKNLLRTMLLNENYLAAYNLAVAIGQEPEVSFQTDDAIVLALTKLGQGDKALAHLSGMDQRIRNSPQFMLLEANALNLAGRTDEAMPLLEQIFADYPNHLEAQQNAIFLLLSMGDEAKARAYLDLYLSMHSAKPGALISLAKQLTDLPKSEYVKRIYDFSLKSRNPNTYTIEFLLAQAYLTEGKWAQAVQTADTWRARVVGEIEDPQVELLLLLFEEVRTPAVATEDAVVTLLKQYEFTPELYWEVVNTFGGLNRFSPAIVAADMAVARYPYNAILIDQRKAVIKRQQDHAAGRAPGGQGKVQSYHGGGLPLMDNQEMPESGF